MKTIEKLEKVRYIQFKDGEVIQTSCLYGLFTEFNGNYDKELKDYELNTGYDILGVLIKYGFVHNWRGERQADMYKLDNSFDKILEIIGE